MSLTQEQISHYCHQGYLCPLEAFSEEEAKQLRAELESIEASQGKVLDRGQCNKSYLLFNWADKIVHHPQILDQVESLIGSDILCYMSNLFIKEPHSDRFVSMHQDAQYWGVEADDVVTVWLALSPATEASGAMKILPASHHTLLEQANTYAKGNLLTRGQTIAESELEGKPHVFLELQPGQMSLHHFKLIHGSAPNTTDDRRIGLAIRYVNANAKKVGLPESAMLVRGENKGNFLLEKRINGLSDKQKRRQHASALRKQIRNIFQPSSNTGFGERLRLQIMKRVALTMSYWLTLKSW
ncbi:phytanoyl-CoA dioxygenase [Parashewanella curva]|uniref:Phytanoyl-CoA dioxygenase n=1 Tax=Parashewanella curva TaxID=2338552 RepID=A0A3L8PV41_9GAMM|nr:phytanoyl-CoA dioxygenase family protein [Parashewanella curva]RLV59210.1 phytanoyl-CoA dioxygenase [Parashewanella curva]